VTPVDVNLTYVSFFHLPKPLIPNWMLHGSQTGAHWRGQGGSTWSWRARCSIVSSSTIPKVECGEALNSPYIPKLKRLCPNKKCTLVSFGAWAGDESRKPGVFVGFSNNLRQHAFEEEGYEVFRKQGFPNSLLMWGLTAPLRGGRHALDPVHYRAPVTQAMIDMVFGSLCKDFKALAY